MPGIRIINRLPEQEGRRTLLYTLFGETGLLVNGLRDSGNAYYAITHENQLDVFLSDETKQKFIDQGFQVLNPPEFNAIKSIIVKNVDKQIEAYGPEEIQTNIENNNHGIIIETLIKLPTATNILKLKLQNQRMVNSATTNGLMIFNQYLPPASIEKEVYIKLTPCFNCFSFKHHTNKCPRPKMTLCASCSAETHNQSQCNADYNKCLNCKEAHHTLAPVCNIRRTEIKERSLAERRKRRERAQLIRSQQSSQIRPLKNHSTNESSLLLNQNDPSEEIVPPIPSVSGDLITKILSAIIFASVQNALQPGTYQQNIDRMYKLNNLSQVNFPPNVITSNIFNLTNTKPLVYPDIDPPIPEVIQTTTTPMTTSNIQEIIDTNIPPQGAQARALSPIQEPSTNDDEILSLETEEYDYNHQTSQEEQEEEEEQEERTQIPTTTRTMRELLETEPIIYYPKSWDKETDDNKPMAKLNIAIRTIYKRHKDTIVTDRYNNDQDEIIQIMKQLMNENKMNIKKIRMTSGDENYLEHIRTEIQKKQQERKAQAHAQGVTPKKGTHRAKIHKTKRKK